MAILMILAIQILQIYQYSTTTATTNNNNDNLTNNFGYLWLADLGRQSEIL